MRRAHLAGIVLLVAGCTPEQVATLSRLYPDAPIALLAAAEDVPARLPDGRVVELDGTVTPAPDRYVHPSADVDRWYDLYIAAGFPAQDWRKWSCRIHRESRGQPAVRWRHRRDDSYGLLQINARAHRADMIRFAGTLDAFFDPFTNLSFAHDLWVRAGDSPWLTASGSCR